MLKHFFSVITVSLAIILTARSGKKSEEEYLSIATEHFNKEEYNLAIENYNYLLEHYPDGIKTPQAMFMIGYIYANNIENFDQARKYYTLFIEKYPEHELARSAQYELETMGQDINELSIFKKIEEESAKNEEVK